MEEGLYAQILRGLLLPPHQQSMKKNIPALPWRLVVVLGASLISIRLPAEESTVELPPYVLSATRTPAALTTTGTFVDTISAAELARMQLNNLRSALSGIPGAPAFQSGASGGMTSLFLRGSNSNQTLLLVDGIRLNDPNTDYAASLGGMGVCACDSLEVAHGPQSTLYGNEAVGGVLSLRAQRGAGTAMQTASFEAGSFGTVQGAVHAQAGTGPTAYNFSAIGGQTDNERPNNDFTSATYVLRLDHQVSKTTAIGATLRGFLGRYASPGDRFTNDPDSEDRESNRLATVFVDFAPTANLTSKVVLGGQDRRYVSENPGPFGPQVTIVKNRRAVFDGQSTLQAGEQHRVTGGLTAELNHTRNTGFGNINERQQLLAFFAQDEWAPVAHIYLTAGLRSDEHDTFGRATTGRATAAWLSKESHWKLRATYGTAFRSPGFLDLYGQNSFFAGNPHLEAERACGWDVGVDYFFADNRGVLSATWFNIHFRNLIVFDFGVFPGTTANVEAARTKGGEVSGKFALPGAVDVRLAYTYLEADNLSQGNRLLRRPRHSGSLDVWRDFGRGFSAGTGLAFAAGRQDVNAATFATIDAEDYVVVRVYGAWQTSPRVTLKARVENLLDEKYEEVHGYPQLGVGAFAGVEWKF
ncbi:MAG: TonB-dependent receptor [Lacunisphaera sp.]|nr:TonB-dependent receptor [Lacunisphaera sp.]